MMKVLGFSGSPRVNGNTELLLKELLRGASDAGADTELIQVRKVRFDPCISCNRCFKTGRCEVEDAFQPIYDKIVEADHIVLASPIYFMGVTAWAKTFIDRCQCFWAKKYILKEPLPQYRGEHAEARSFHIHRGLRSAGRVRRRGIHDEIFLRRGRRRPVEEPPLRKNRRQGRDKIPSHGDERGVRNRTGTGRINFFHIYPRRKRKTAYCR